MDAIFTKKNSNRLVGLLIKFLDTSLHTSGFIYLSFTRNQLAKETKVSLGSAAIGLLQTPTFVGQNAKLHLNMSDVRVRSINSYIQCHKVEFSKTRLGSSQLELSICCSE